MDEIDQSGGWLQIKGFGISREVFVNGRHLEIGPSMEVRHHSSEFNWGYNGSGPTQLALALLMLLMDGEDALKYYQAFKYTVMSSLPQQDFDVKVNISEWLRLIKTHDGRKVHGYHLIQVGIGQGYYISKFVDLPYLPFSTARFDHDTIEFGELNDMGDEEWDVFINYCEKCTTHNSIDGKQSLKMNVKLSPTTPAMFTVTGGMGRSMQYRGHKVEIYGKIK